MIVYVNIIMLYGCDAVVLGCVLIFPEISWKSKKLLSVLCTDYY